MDTSTVYAHVFKKETSNAKKIDDKMNDYLQKTIKQKHS
jgi:hypothetical protein